MFGVGGQDRSVRDGGFVVGWRVVRSRRAEFVDAGRLRRRTVVCGATAVVVGAFLVVADVLWGSLSSGSGVRDLLAVVLLAGAAGCLVAPFARVAARGPVPPEGLTGTGAGRSASTASSRLGRPRWRPRTGTRSSPARIGRSVRPRRAVRLAARRVGARVAGTPRRRSGDHRPGEAAAGPAGVRRAAVGDVRRGGVGCRTGGGRASACPRDAGLIRRPDPPAWPAVVVGTGVRDDLPWADALPT